MYVRVKDPSNGHEFDRPEGDPLIEQGLLKDVTSKRWPHSNVERPPKHHIPTAPANRPDQSATSAEAPQDATEQE